MAARNVRDAGTYGTWGISPTVRRALVRNILDLRSAVEDDFRKQLIALGLRPTGAVTRARGDAREDSDYDIIVLLGAPDAGSHDDQVRAVTALRGVHRPVDAIVMSADRFEWLSGAAASLPATVKREGRLIHAS